MKTAGIILPPSKEPGIAKIKADHKLTKSWGRSTASLKFREEVAELLRRGDFEGALKKEFDDIERIRNGDYGQGLEDLARYIHDDLKNFRR